MRFLNLVVFVGLVMGSAAAVAALPEPFLKLIPEPSPDYAGDLTRLAKQQDAQGDFFRLKLAEKQVKEGDVSKALKTVSGVKSPIFSFWKTVVTAKIYSAQNKYREVLALLRRLPPKPNYEMFFGEGMYDNLYKRALILRYLARRGLDQNAFAEAADLIANYPGDAEVNAILADEDKEAPLTTLQKIDKLNALASRYKYKEIAGLITAAEIKRARISKYEKCRALFELGNGLKTDPNLRDNAIMAFEDVLALGCDSNFIPRTLYRLGYLKPSPGSLLTDKRKQYNKRLFKEYPAHRLADDAIYRLYQIALQEGNQSAARRYFDQLMGLKKGDMKSELVFETAYPLYEKKNYKKAAALFARALKTESTADESYPRILYWHARSLEKTGNKKLVSLAKHHYGHLVDNFPFSFYAILAAGRINRTVKVPKLPELTGEPPENGLEYFALIDKLNGKGYHEAARAVLEIALQKHPEWENTHKQYLAKKLIESRNYRKAIDLASKHFESGVYGPITGAVTDPMFAAFYPWAFPDKTRTGYQKYGLPRGTIEGIMREESLFQRTASSWVGATGLMQLMPSTAAMLRREIPELDNGRPLTDPESNILMGSSYLKKMHRYFLEQLPLAIMAYNAGPGNVNKWLRRFGNMELDEFIENIPLSETRNYVKRVMRSMQVYGALYGEEFFKKPTYFSFQINRKDHQIPRSQRKRKR